MYVFFWVFPQRLIKIAVADVSEHYQFHLQRLDVRYEDISFLTSSMKILHTSHPALEDGTDRVFRNVGILQF